MKTCPVCDTDFPDQHATCPSDGAVLIVSHELAVGSLVKNKYKIAKILGKGGMGVVYLADHMLLGGQVALKFLAAGLSHNPQFIKRFRNEAQAAFSLRHPNIVQVLDLDQTEDGSLFIAMEYVEGNSLRQALDEERNGFGVPRALELARGMVSGLAAAHARGIVHRDVKPENVLLARAADSREQPKVLDFGIAAMAKSSTQSNMTRGRLLTAEYAAPEQWMEMPAAEIDGRTDLYAMGCVIYEMLTGHTPFHAHNMEGCRRQHMEETPKPPSELRPELADWMGLDGLVMRLLAKNRDDRPQDAEALSLLDSVQPDPRVTQRAPGKEWQKTVAVSDWNRQQTISEESQKWKEVAQSQVSQQVSQAQKPAPQKTPVWVWGIVAIPALAAGVAVAWYFSPKPQPPQPQQTQDTTTHPVVIPPLQAGANTNIPIMQPSQNSNPTFTTAPSTSQKPSSSTKTNIQPATEVPSSNQNQKPAQTNNPKPPVIQPPAVNPPVQKPSIGDLTQQGVTLYGQKRYTEAAALFGIACTGGGWEACKDLGIMYRYGQGMQEDDKKAEGLFTKACDAGNALGCTNLGALYANGGKGVDQDVTRAAKLYTKACNAGEAMGCSNLGNCYWYGRGVDKNPETARQLYTKSCSLKNTVACDRLKELK